MSTHFKSYNVDAHKVEASDSMINGNNNMIFGNNNRIAGDNNKVYGNNNAIVGNGNIVKGENNTAKGNNNEVYDPFGNVYTPATPSSPYSPSNPFASSAQPSAPSPHFFAPPAPQGRAPSPAPPSYVRPVATRERSATYPAVNPFAQEPPAATFQPIVNPLNSSNSGTNYFQPTSNPLNSSNSGNNYFQPISNPLNSSSSGSNSHFQPIQPASNFSPASNNSYFQPVQQHSPDSAFFKPVQIESNPYAGGSSYAQSQVAGYPAQATPSAYGNNGSAYFQPVQDVVPVYNTQPVAAYLVVAPAPSPVPNAAPPSPTPYANPFGSPVAEKDKKEKDLIQDGTLVFIVNETEAEYVREFCNLVSTNSGQRLGCHISAGRMCLVGLGDLNKIRDTIIQNLPLLNLRLKEWSWNTFGKNVCSDKEVYFKKMFKEYTREDVDCWRSKPTKVAA